MTRKQWANKKSRRNAGKSRYVTYNLPSIVIAMSEVESVSNIFVETQSSNNTVKITMTFNMKSGITNTEEKFFVVQYHTRTAHGVFTKREVKTPWEPGEYFDAIGDETNVDANIIKMREYNERLKRFRTEFINTVSYNA